MTNHSPSTARGSTRATPASRKCRVLLVATVKLVLERCRGDQQIRTSMAMGSRRGNVSSSWGKARSCSTKARQGPLLKRLEAAIFPNREDHGHRPVVPGHQLRLGLRIELVAMLANLSHKASRNYRLETWNPSLSTLLRSTLPSTSICLAGWPIGRPRLRYWHNEPNSQSTFES